MKFNESVNQKTMQPAAAPVHQDALPPVLPNRAARRAKSVNRQEPSKLSMPSQPQSLRAHLSSGDGVQVIDRILRLPEVLAMVGIGRTLLISMVKNQQFPAPLKLSARIRGWRLSAIQDFLDSKEAE